MSAVLPRHGATADGSVVETLPTVSDHCRDMRHTVCDGCTECGCHALQRALARVSEKALAAGVTAFLARDVVAHLISPQHIGKQVSVEKCADLVCLLIDLGWRPTAAHAP